MSSALFLDTNLQSRTLLLGGRVLPGTRAFEVTRNVRSVREGKVNMGDSFCYITSKGEMYVKNMHISEYKFGTYNNHNPLSIRKLLLSKQELKKIGQKTKEKGFTIVPVKLYFTERGFIKLHIALAQGKKSYDKRDSMKERDSKRDLDRVKKEYK